MANAKGVRSPGIYVYIYGEKIYVYIYFLGSFGNLASLGSRMNGKWKLHGERSAIFKQGDRQQRSPKQQRSRMRTIHMHIVKRLMVRLLVGLG